MLQSYDLFKKIIDSHWDTFGVRHIPAVMEFLNRHEALGLVVTFEADEIHYLIPHRHHSHTLVEYKVPETEVQATHRLWRTVTTEYLSHHYSGKTVFPTTVRGVNLDMFSDWVEALKHVDHDEPLVLAIPKNNATESPWFGNHDPKVAATFSDTILERAGVKAGVFQGLNMVHPRFRDKGERLYPSVDLETVLGKEVTTFASDEDLDMEDGKFGDEFDDYKDRLDWVLADLDLSFSDRDQIKDAVEISFKMSAHGYELRAVLKDGTEIVTGKNQRPKE